MTTVRELHRSAMESADLAEAALRARQQDTADQHLKRAAEMECQAAALVEANFDLEPTRSVLHRSAATLLLRAGDWQRAEKLVASALRGNPPDALATELRDLLESIYAERHLALRGIVLGNNELQLSVAGPAVGFGFAPTKDVY